MLFCFFNLFSGKGGLKFVVEMVIYWNCFLCKKELLVFEVLYKYLNKFFVIIRFNIGVMRD